MTLLGPARPKLLGIAQRMIGRHRFRRFLMRFKPGENEWNAVALFYGEFGDRSQIFALRLDRGPQNQTIRACNCLQSAVPLAHPGHDVAIVEANDEFHLQRDLATQAFDDSDKVRVLSARWHEIDESHGATRGFDFGLQNQGIAAISSPRRCNLFARKKSPVALLSFA